MLPEGGDGDHVTVGATAGVGGGIGSAVGVSSPIRNDRGGAAGDVRNRRGSLAGLVDQLSGLARESGPNASGGTLGASASSQSGAFVARESDNPPPVASTIGAEHGIAELAGRSIRSSRESGQAKGRADYGRDGASEQGPGVSFLSESGLSGIGNGNDVGSNLGSPYGNATLLRRTGTEGHLLLRAESTLVGDSDAGVAATGEHQASLAFLLSQRDLPRIGNTNESGVSSGTFNGPAGGSAGAGSAAALLLGGATNHGSSGSEGEGWRRIHVPLEGGALSSIVLRTMCGAGRTLGVSNTTAASREAARTAEAQVRLR